jgi:hypothetical protein
MDPLRCVFVRAIGHSTTLPLTAIRSEAAVGRHDHRIDLSEYALHPVELFDPRKPPIVAYGCWRSSAIDERGNVTGALRPKNASVTRTEPGEGAA